MDWISGFYRDEGVRTMTTEEVRPPCLPSDYIKRGWTQLDLAVDSAGRAVATDDDRAVAWSVSGATWASMRAGRITLREKLLMEQHIEAKEMLNLSAWNDSRLRYKEHVLAALLDAERTILHS